MPHVLRVTAGNIRARYPGQNFHRPPEPPITAWPSHRPTAACRAAISSVKTTPIIAYGGSPASAATTRAVALTGHPAPPATAGRAPARGSHDEHGRYRVTQPPASPRRGQPGDQPGHERHEPQAELRGHRDHHGAGHRRQPATSRTAPEPAAGRTSGRAVPRPSCPSRRRRAGAALPRRACRTREPRAGSSPLLPSFRRSATAARQRGGAGPQRPVDGPRIGTGRSRHRQIAPVPPVSDQVRRTRGTPGSRSARPGTRPSAVEGHPPEPGNPTIIRQLGPMLDSRPPSAASTVQPSPLDARGP